MAGHPAKKTGSMEASEALPTKVIFEASDRVTSQADGSKAVTQFYVRFEQLNGKAAFDQFNFYPKPENAFDSITIHEDYTKSLQKLVDAILPPGCLLSSFGGVSFHEGKIKYPFAEIFPRLEDSELLTQIRMVVEKHHQEYLQTHSCKTARDLLHREQESKLASILRPGRSEKPYSVMKMAGQDLHCFIQRAEKFGLTCVVADLVGAHSPHVIQTLRGLPKTVRQVTVTPEQLKEEATGLLGMFRKAARAFSVCFEEMDLVQKTEVQAYILANCQLLKKIAENGSIGASDKSVDLPEVVKSLSDVVALPEKVLSLVDTHELIEIFLEVYTPSSTAAESLPFGVAATGGEAASMAGAGSSAVNDTRCSIQ